jgi:glycosyltransferase involved in cell wall biosynthesis
MVFFAWRPGWVDQNVLDGYHSEFLRRASTEEELSGPWALRDPDIVRALVKGRYEVLWLYGYNYAVHVLAAATMRLRGMPIMFQEDQTLLHPRGVLKAAAKEVGLRALFKGSFGLYAGSESKRWFEHFGVPRERLFAVRYSVDNERLHRAHAELGPRRSELRRSFGLPEDQPLFLTVSRLVAKKQPLAVLEAFRRARQRIGCSLLIVGSGEFEGVIREEIARRDIPDVAVAGWLSQSELPRAFACADAFVLFSRSENWGVVVNEAMNFGLPVLVSDKVGSGTDLVEDDRNGYVIAIEDIESLSDRMVQLGEDSRLRQKLGRRSLEIIEDWNVEAAAQGIIDAVVAAVGPARWARAEPAA